MRSRKISVLLRITFIVLFLAPSFVFNSQAKNMEKTRLYLIGMGPGDSDLITLRGLNAIEKADIIVCPSNRLRENFASCLKGKEMIEVEHELWRSYGEDCSSIKGDKKDECPKKQLELQDFINRVRSAAKSGKTIAVLDSGDPFIYGPWNWVIEEFKDLNPTSVPGVSAFNAANAALQKDVCRGKNAHSVILTSRWGVEQLGKVGATLVVFTMKSEFEDLIKKLSVNYPPESPIAIIVYAGYMEKEKIITATLGTIIEKVGNEKLPFEYIIYLGDFLTYQSKK